MMIRLQHLGILVSRAASLVLVTGLACRGEQRRAVAGRGAGDR